MPEFAIPNFLGGINEAVDNSLIKINEANKAQNCEIQKGVLSTSKGYSLFANFPSATTIKTVMTYYRNGSIQLLIAAGGKLFKYNDGVISEIGTGFSSDYWDYVNNNSNSEDVIILTNGIDNVKVYNGTTLRDLKNRWRVDSTHWTDANGTTYATEALCPSVSPKGFYIDVHYERVWICDNNMVYFSTVNKDGIDIDDFTIQIDAEGVETNNHGGEIFLYTNDGSKLIGFKVIFDDIVLYKEKSIYKIFGSSPSNYQKVQIFSAAGGIADRSIAVNEKGSFHIDRKGIYFYDGVNVALISQKISDTFLTLNKNYLKNACGFIWEDKYILAVPEGSSTVNNLIIEYNFNNKNFMFKRGFTVSSFVDYQDRLLFVGADNNIYNYSVTDLLNTLPMVCYWETGYSNQNLPNAVKELETLYFTGFGVGQIKITIITDKGSKEKLVTLSGTEKVYKINLSSRGRIIKVKFENVTGSVFTIKSPKIILSLDGD